MLSFSYFSISLVIIQYLFIQYIYDSFDLFILIFQHICLIHKMESKVSISLEFSELKYFLLRNEFKI